MRASLQDRNQAPHDQHHDHHGGDLHDLHGALAGLVNALDVLPPEVDGHENGDHGGEQVVGHREVLVAEVVNSVGDEAGQILAGGDGADRAGENVVEEQGGDG